MPRRILPISLLVAALAVPAMTSAGPEDRHFSLTWLDRFRVEDRDEDLHEPSGLRGGNALWTVSDDTKKVFKLSLEGKVDEDRSFEIDVDGLEGIALGPSDDVLVAVKEDGNEIVVISIDEKEVTSRHALAGMAGYDAVEPLFEGSDENKGLEGITFNMETETLFVLKEGEPGVLIEISQDLDQILDHRHLDETSGLSDDEEKPEDIDYSGIHYEGTGALFWIVSDKAKRLYLYDWDRNAVVQSATLGFTKDGEYREVEKAEGVTLDPDTRRLYVITDVPEDDGSDELRIEACDSYLRSAEALK